MTRTLFGALALSLVATSAVAQEEPPMRARAVGIYDGHPPVIDGRLEPLWERAPAVVDAGPEAPERRRARRTEVRFMYDHEALYVAARMYSDDPGEIRTLVTRRDDPSTAESFLLSLDLNGDRRTAHTFEVTAGGTRVDYYHPHDRFYPRLLSYDAVWTAAAAVDSAGWVAEMRIPLSQLARQGARDGSWGLDWARFIPARNLKLFWIRVPPRETGWASRFGELAGVFRIGPSRYVEFLPYVSGERTFAEGDSALSALEEGFEARAGLDVEAGLGPGALRLTVNPDFGQIEADPAEINLSAYETYFAERRPFFVEAGNAFRAPGPHWLYTRRIGAAPRLPGDLVAVDVPRATTVLGAGTFTAVSDGGWSTAVLAALTGRERARISDPGTGELVSNDVQPPTGFAAARVQRQFGAGGSTVGALVTMVERLLDDEDPLASRIGSRAVAGGGDWALRSASGIYELAGHAGFSLVEGSAAFVRALQESSAHYYQRPDADHVEVDPTATSLVGWTASARARKIAGRHWLWGAEVEARSPGFEVNDAGIMRSADDVDLSAHLRYKHFRGGRHQVRMWETALFADAGWNTDGVRQYARPTLFGRLSFRNYMAVWAQAGLSLPALSDDLTRGGPLMETPRGWNAEMGASGDRREVSGWRLSGSANGDEAGGSGWSLGGEVWYRPGASTELSVASGFSRWKDARQYYATLPDGPAETFGQRYVFSTVDLRELRLQLRAEHSLTPDLSLQLYAEPFSSSGRFSDFGELPAPGAGELRSYDVERRPDGSWSVTDGDTTFALDDADFTLTSLRGTAVVRWEWRRGSTLFVIWQRDQFASVDEGDPTSPGDVVSIFKDSAAGTVTSTVALKLTWWLPVN